MKTPNPAAAKRLNADNLRALGQERLADLLLEFGDAYPSLKRRLRMELAAEVGPEHLAVEIDKRLNTLATSRAKISWRKRSEFIADLQVQRAMIAERLGRLSPDLAVPRLFAFLALPALLAFRVKDSKDELPPIFLGAADALGDLAALSAIDPEDLADQLAHAIQADEANWAQWLSRVLGPLDREVGRALLGRIEQGTRRSVRRPALLRALADAAGDADAYIRTLPLEVRAAPAVGAEIARRLLAADRVSEALTALGASTPISPRARFGWAASKLPPDPAGVAEWEVQHIEAVERSGDTAAAQTLRWETFERTLSPDPLKAYLKRLADFDDVIAADKAFVLAAAWPDMMTGLSFLMTWPALPEAAAMVIARRAEIKDSDDRLPNWAARLEARQPLAALILLRRFIAGAIRGGAPKSDPDLISHLAHAEAMFERVAKSKDVESHEEFVARL